MDAPHCVLLCLTAEVKCVLVGFNHAQGICAMYVYGAAGVKVGQEDGMKWYLNEGSSKYARALSIMAGLTVEVIGGTMTFTGTAGVGAINRPYMWCV